jgi:hypothetical protein
VHKVCLAIATAPAEFWGLMEQDRQITTSFNVQALFLPLFSVCAEK